MMDFSDILMPLLAHTSAGSGAMGGFYTHLKT